MPHYNISPAVLSENPFPVRKSKDHTPYSYAVIQRMYSKGYNNIRLEVARAANGVLVTSTDAIVRYELAINERERNLAASGVFTQHLSETSEES